jgi:hypothetical protein
VSVGDLNGDGALDLVATGSIDGYFGRYDYYDPYWQYEGYGYRYYSASYVNVLLGDGNGGFGTAEARFLGYDVYPWHVTVADLNADGHDDVIIAKDQGLSVLLGDGTGSLGNAIDSGTGSGIGVSSISLGDVDGDGNLDTLLTDGNGGLSVQRGDGQGSFTAMPIVSAGGPIDSAVMGDVNGDGMLDLVAVGSYQGDFSGEWRQSMVLLGDGVGNFAPPRISGLVTNGRMGSIALEDLNGDGFPELVTVDSYNDAVVVATNSGDWNLYSAPSPATIGISDATVVEGDDGTANAVFTVSIEGDFDNVSVDYATVGSAAVEGSDYAATSGTLTFAAGETSQTISVPIIGDTTDEYDEQFFVDLSNAAGGEITDSQGIGTIQDDDPAPLLTSPLTVHGTAGDDVLEFYGGDGLHFSVNGVRYDYTLAQSASVTFLGGGGNDSIRVVRSNDVEDIAVAPTWVALTHPDYVMQAVEVEAIEVVGAFRQAPLQNSSNSADVNNDGVVNFGDILDTIAALRNTAAGEGTSGATTMFYDVNGDTHLNFGDILAIISVLRGRTAGGEGEASSLATSSPYREASLSTSDQTVYTADIAVAPSTDTVAGFTASATSATLPAPRIETDSVSQLASPSTSSAPESVDSSILIGNSPANLADEQQEEDQATPDGSNLLATDNYFLNLGEYDRRSDDNLGREDGTLVSDLDPLDGSSPDAEEFAALLDDVAREWSALE